MLGRFLGIIGRDPSVFQSPTGYMLTSFGTSLLILGIFSWNPLKCWVVPRDSWISTGYSSNSTDSSVTSSWFSPFIVKYDTKVLVVGVHNIVQIHNDVMWDWQYSTDYSLIFPTFSLLCAYFGYQYNCQCHRVHTFLFFFLTLNPAVETTTL